MLFKRTQEVINGSRTLSHNALMGSTPHMWGEVNVSKPQKRIIRLDRLWIEYVCTISCDVAGTDEIGHCALVNERSATHIDQKYSPSTHEQAAPINKVLVISR
jgi:hypothetical protein